MPCRQERKAVGHCCSTVVHIFARPIHCLEPNSDHDESIHDSEERDWEVGTEAMYAAISRGQAENKILQ